MISKLLPLSIGAAVSMASVKAKMPIYSEDDATEYFLRDIRQLDSGYQGEIPELFFDVDEAPVVPQTVSLGQDENLEVSDETQSSLKEWTIDMRCKEYENWIARFVYGPYLLAIAILTVCGGIFVVKKLINYQTLDDDEIQELDQGSWVDFTVRELYDFNKKRGEEGKPMLKDMELLVIHNYINNRTEFATDDTFAQRVACDAYIYKMQTKHLSKDEQVAHNKTGINDYTGVHNSGYEALVESNDKDLALVSRAHNYKKVLWVLCFMSIFTSALALSQILTDLIDSEKSDRRVFVLAPWKNLLLRFCFIVIITIVNLRDLNMISCNMQVRMTGAIQNAPHSRWLLVEYTIRMGLNLLASITILLMILTTSASEPESAIDQTMNFTALLILLEIDNILGAILQTKIDQFDVGFSYDAETVEYEFNRAADFWIERNKKFWIQKKIEDTIVGLILFGIYVVFIFVPWAMLLPYIIMPVDVNASTCK